VFTIEQVNVTKNLNFTKNIAEKTHTQEHNLKIIYVYIITMTDKVKTFDMTKEELERLKKGDTCYDGPLTGNVKCIVLSLFLASFYWYAPPKNKWILVGILYFTYLALAYYDYHYDCRYGEFGPSPLRHFYEFAKPKNSKQAIVYKSLCKNKSNLILIIDVVILIGILAFLPTFLKWQPSKP